MVYSWQIFTYDLKVFGKDWRYIQRAIVPNHINHSPPTKLYYLPRIAWKWQFEKSHVQLIYGVKPNCMLQNSYRQISMKTFLNDYYVYLKIYKLVYIISKVFVGHSIPTAAASEAWWLVHVVESVWIKNLFVITHKYKHVVQDFFKTQTKRP